jgi:hypothetical protein
LLGNLGLTAIGHEDFAGQAGEAPAGNAHAQKAAEKTAIEIGIEAHRADDRTDFLFRFRRGDAPNAIEVAPEKARAEAFYEKCHDFNLRMHGVPKNAFLEVFLVIFKPGAKSGFEIVWRVHGVWQGSVLLLHITIRFRGMPPSDLGGMPSPEWQTLRMSRKRLFQSVLLRDSVSQKSARHCQPYFAVILPEISKHFLGCVLAIL